MTPVMAMKRRPVAVMGRLRSWAWAIVLLELSAFPTCFYLGGFVRIEEGSIRETKVCNHSGLVECHTIRSDGKSSPYEGKEPQAEILE
jgi:hypothetical protein